MITPVSFFKCSKKLTIQDAWNALRSDNFEVIFTSVRLTPRFSCVATSFENHSLYMFWMKAFAAYFTLIFRCYNMLVKLWGTTTTDIVFSKVNLSSAKNWGDASTLPVVLLRLLHFSCFSTSLAQRSVRSKLPLNSFNASGLFTLTTPFEFAFYL